MHKTYSKNAVGCLDVQMDEQMDGWMDKQKDEWANGWID